MTSRCLLFSALLFTAALGSARAQTDQEVEARKTALDVAGAFTNDGFKLRDGHWAGAVKPGDHALIAVNLYAGNQYWFSVGANEAAKKIGVDIYDENGRQLAADNYNAGEKAAAGFSPVNSGQYFISVNLLEGAASSLCLVYSYK
jgi:hypothetical protein